MSHQKGFIELKRAGKLSGELMNTIQPLKKHGTPLVLIKIWPMSTSVSKTVAKLQPFTAYQHFESLKGENMDFKTTHQAIHYSSSRGTQLYSPTP